MRDDSTEKQRQSRLMKACTLLIPKGFLPVGYMLFGKNGITYDLGAADLDMIDLIEREGLMVV